MKSWNQYSKSEKGMLITVGILLVLLLATSGRVSEGVQKGFQRFFSTPSDTVQTVK